MNEPLDIVIVEDVPADAELAAAELRRAGVTCTVRRVETEAELLAALTDRTPDIVLSDFALPAFDGLAALRLMAERAPQMPFIIVTGSLNEETAVECMKAGAWDYVLKDRLARLPAAVLRALDLARTRAERARAEDELRQNQELVRLLSDAVPVLMSYVGDDMRYRSVNKGYAAWFGGAPDDYRGRLVSEVIGEAAWSAVRRHVERALAGERVSFDAEVAYARGGVRSVQATYTPDRDADGKVRGFVALVYDMTQLKTTERALRESEERYRGMFEQAPIGIYRTTPDGRILFANPALVRMLGYDSVEELCARNLEGEGFDPAYPRGSFKLALERAGIVRGLEGVWTRKDGRRIYVEENAQATVDEDGRVLHYDGTVEDVTPRRKAEEAQRLLSAAVEQSAEAVVVTDTEGWIQYVNPAFTRITGWAADEAYGRRTNLLKSGQQDEAFYKGLWATIAAGRVWSGHLINRRKDGTLYEEEMTISPVRDVAAAIVNFVAVKRDVSREVALRLQLNQAQKMEAVGRLAGGIAHDFNNVLQAMLSLLAVLRHRLAADAGAGRLVEELDQLVQRGASLTRQLLLFSRRETTVREHLDLNEIVRGAIELLRRVVRENVAIVAELASSPLAVLADRGQVDQVLMNLAVNASDAMPDGGTLTFRTIGDAACARLEVTDTGHGIPDDVRAHLFEPFFTTKAKGKGTGLGLSVVHGIVTSHAGRIEIESDAGAGTTFAVILPLAAVAEHEEAVVRGSDAELPCGAGERVLVVEDEDAAREGLVQILDMLGYEAVAVGDGTQAALLPDAPAFDLVLSDLMLPGAPGPEVVAALQLRWPAMSVILMSGYTEDEALRRSVADRHVHFLQKPFDVATLAAMVRRVLGGGAPGDLGG